MTRDVQLHATACRDCENVGFGENDVCEQCKSNNVFQVDFVNALARHLSLTYAVLDYIDELPGLTLNGHVAAMLRY